MSSYRRSRLMRGLDERTALIRPRAGPDEVGSGFLPPGSVAVAPPRPRWRLARPWLLWALLILPLFAVTACTDAGERKGPPKEGAGQVGFVQASGRELVVDGKPTRLASVNFSNLYHRQLDGADLLESQHHSEADFVRVNEMGFNSIRFAFDGNWYLDDPDVFWKWLDQNVGWARQHRLRLILDLHTPIGGFWLDPTSDAVSFDIWSDPRLQQQNVQLWRDIATRYQNEPVIAAYDLLNEPVTTDSTGKQWKDFAQQLVDAVRSVDKNHLLVMGGLYGVNSKYGTDGVNPHFLVDDKNVMYDFHFYEPIKYTHQYASWVTGPVQDGGRYPDPQVIMPTGSRVRLSETNIATPPLRPGTTDWKVYDSGPIAIRDKSAVAAMPLFVAKGGMRGKAYFDAVTVTEYGPDGTKIRDIVNDQLDKDDTLSWYQWESGGKAPASAKFTRERTGYRDGGSLSITDAPQTGAIAGWSNDDHLFKVVPGNQYRTRAYMRGQDVGPSSRTAPAIGVQLDVYAKSPKSAGGGFLKRDKTYLAYEMRKHLQFGIDNQVPMSVMEFGVVRQAFQMEGKGGGQWVTDMLALLKENDLSFGYWEYHGDQMGMYLSGSGQPSKPNAALQEVLKRELR